MFMELLWSRQKFSRMWLELLFAPHMIWCFLLWWFVGVSFNKLSYYNECMMNCKSTLVSLILLNNLEPGPGRRSAYLQSKATQTHSLGLGIKGTDVSRWINCFPHLPVPFLAPVIFQLSFWTHGQDKKEEVSPILDQFCDLGALWRFTAASCPESDSHL